MYKNSPSFYPSCSIISAYAYMHEVDHNINQFNLSLIQEGILSISVTLHLTAGDSFSNYWNDRSSIRGCKSLHLQLLTLSVRMLSYIITSVSLDTASAILCVVLWIYIIQICLREYPAICSVTMLAEWCESVTTTTTMFGWPGQLV